MANWLYQLEGVRKRYDARTVLEIDALDVARGQITAVVGPSGAGKSTLLRLLGFLETPDQGQLAYLGRPVVDGYPDLAARRRVTMVFQEPHLLNRTVRENLRYGLGLRGRKNGEAEPIVESLLERLGLDELAGTAAHKLSGGEMQRVALGRALALRPSVLLLDEPTANLDPYNVRLIEEMVRSANADDGVSVVMVTHNIFQARRLADRVVLLISGALVEEGPAAQFFSEPRSPQAAAFVRGDLVY